MTQFKQLAIALAVSTLMACSAAAAMADGTYTGVDQGKNGDVTVELQVTGGNSQLFAWLSTSKHRVFLMPL